MMCLTTTALETQKQAVGQTGRETCSRKACLVCRSRNPGVGVLALSRLGGELERWRSVAGKRCITVTDTDIPRRGLPPE